MTKRAVLLASLNEQTSCVVGEFERTNELFRILLALGEKCGIAFL